MPLTTIASYVETADQIVAHWTDVNADRVANTLPDLELQGAYSLGSFTSDRDALSAAISGLQGAVNAQELAIGDRDAQKENLRERLRQFRAAARVHFKSTKYYNALPKLPAMGQNESKFVRPLDDMQDLWARIDADASIPGFTPPLVLRGAYSQAGFTADLATMRSFFLAVTDAENDLTMARRQRDTMLDPLRERMIQYHAAIELEYGEGHALFESLPALWPSTGSTPGGTPTPVTLSGQWNDAAQQAEFDWNESADPDVSHYSLRESLGATYDASNAVELESIPAGTSSIATSTSLTMPGDVGSYRLYVVLNNLDESASNTVTITRS